MQYITFYCLIIEIVLNCGQNLLQMYIVYNRNDVLSHSTLIYMDFNMLLQLSKLLHLFVKVISWICLSYYMDSLF